MERLDIWLNDARASGIYGMRRFVRTLRQDIGGGSQCRPRTMEQWADGRTDQPIEDAQARTYMAALALTCFALGCSRCREKICIEIEAEPHIWQRDTHDRPEHGLAFEVTLFEVRHGPAVPLAQTIPFRACKACN